MRQFVIVAVLLPLFGMSLPASEQESRALSRARASTVANVVKFTVWPSAKVGREAALRLCVLEADHVADAFDALPATALGNWEQPVRRMTTNEQPIGCDLLYLGDIDGGRAKMMLSGIRLFPVLTVGGSEAMSQAGAIAAVFPVGEGMRIAVNPAAARQANLHLSSRLMALTTVVRP